MASSNVNTGRMNKTRVRGRAGETEQNKHERERQVEKEKWKVKGTDREAKRSRAGMLKMHTGKSRSNVKGAFSKFP